MVTHHTVKLSWLEAPAWVEVPVAVRDDRYEVTVRGPNHFRRRFAGTFPSPARCTCDHFASGDAWGIAANASTIASTATRVGAFSLATSSKNAALLVTLAPGGYTAVVTAPATTSGVSLDEVYDATTGQIPRTQRLA